MMHPTFMQIFSFLEINGILNVNIDRFNNIHIWFIKHKIAYSYIKQNSLVNSYFYFIVSKMKLLIVNGVEYIYRTIVFMACRK